jgi:hypothetical protein
MYKDVQRWDVTIHNRDYNRHKWRRVTYEIYFIWMNWIMTSLFYVQ